jgi:hypothetical protein
MSQYNNFENGSSQVASVHEGTTSFEGDAIVSGSAIDTSVLNTDLAEQNEGLDEFLSRPVVISTFTWSGATAASTIKPWGLWASIPSVQRKLNNYAFLSGNLHLRFEVNATPYHYGLLLATYMPNPFVGANYDATSVAQLPQCFEQTHAEIEPQSNNVYELTCPFVYNSRKFSISRNSLATLGALSFVPLTALRLSNSATVTPITIKVYAWMTDHILEAPTVANVIKYQSAKVSKPPKLTTKAHGILDTAYSIGNTILGWAEWLGFSRPPVTTSYELYSTRALDLVNVEGTDNIQTIAMAAGNERPLYFPTVGADVPDPLLLSELCGREGIMYWNQPLQWPTTATPNTVITSFPVTPAMMSMTSNAVNTQVYLPPCSYFSQRFAYWRGTMIYRIKVVCSKQHSGKLRVYYDPLGGPNSFSALADDPQNTTRVHVMDISAETCTEFTVGWCNDKPFLPLQVGGKIWDVYNPTTAKFPASNGFITIETVSYLSAPLTSADISIHVFARAGPDFELLEPNAWDIFSVGASLSPITLPTALTVPLIQEKQSGIFKLEYKDANKVELVKPQPCGDYAVELSGERCVSWRPFLKRYQVEQNSVISGNYASTPGNYSIITSILNKYPITTKYYGDASATAWPPQMLNMTLIGICFSGQRGGVKTKVALPPRLATTLSASDIITRFWILPKVSYQLVPGFVRLSNTLAQFLQWQSSINHSVGDVYINDKNEPLGAVFHDYSNVLFEPNSLTHVYATNNRTYTAERDISIALANEADSGTWAPILLSAAADDYDVVAYTQTPRIVFNTAYIQPGFQNNL